MMVKTSQKQDILMTRGVEDIQPEFEGVVVESGDGEVILEKKVPDETYYYCELYFTNGHYETIYLNTNDKNILKRILWHESKSCTLGDEWTGKTHCFHRDALFRAVWRELYKPEVVKALKERIEARGV